MVFSSLIFLYAFFSLSLLAYGLSRTQRQQNTVLLIFSLIFYAWGEPKYVLLLMFMSLVSWACALGVDLAYSRREARIWVLAAARRVFAVSCGTCPGGARALWPRPAGSGAHWPEVAALRLSCPAGRGT